LSGVWPFFGQTESKDLRLPFATYGTNLRLATLELCAEAGQQPDRPFNGKILVRTAPELHCKAALRSAVEGVSLSRWISRQIESAP